MSRYYVVHPFTTMPKKSNLTEEEVNNRFFMANKGERHWVLNKDDQAFLNLSNAAYSLDQSNEIILKAIFEQYNKLSASIMVNQGHWIANKLAEKLLNLAPKFSSVFYSNDGTGAMESALKATRQYFIEKDMPNKQKFISLNGGYHGSSIGALSITNLGFEGVFGDLLQGCISVPSPEDFREKEDKLDDRHAKQAAYELEQAILKAGPETVAAFVIEPVQSVNGIRVFPNLYFQLVRQITRRYNILVIADEITTGIGRTGEWLTSSSLKLDPDIITISKGLTAGYFPLGATLFSSQITDHLIENGSGFPHGTTLSGHPVGCSIAIKVLEIFEKENLPFRAKEAGEYIMNELREGLNKENIIREVRGKGLMIGIELNIESEEEIERFNTIKSNIKKSGILATFSHNVISLYPPLNISKSDMDYMIDALKSSILLID
ncbi:aminotransferase family protein [Chengkuizengella marina]|uniref:Aspartate aminotransferase family protein n=1 Tax=Chengkuizengella marina TaxID=2507566 RepID=A0A6N9Q4N3_9BACL|nr:aminotransferase class III-fold pyridoxal phosphate-dependent enzyme [Chengkuizengella marina]NBI29815.1 aspartate aminotransferase family protein [Chengkuizengella marina]